MNRPITIAGGGLAGLAIGIALRNRGVSVTLHEAGNYPRHRVCGEFLSGVSDGTLERLGITHDLADAVPLRTSCWRNQSRQLGEVTVSGRGLSRHLLDDRLRKRFTALGGTLLTGSRIQPSEGVIWAAGRARQTSPWIGLKCHLRALELTHDLEMHVGTTGYAGLARIEGGAVNLCGLFHVGKASGKGIELLLETLKAGGLHDLADRIASGNPDPASFCGVAGFRFGRSASVPFAIGDSSFMIPPFTGNGMSMALEAADLAIEPALRFASGSIGWTEASNLCATAQQRHFRRRMSLAEILHPVMMSPIGLTLLEKASLTGLPPFKSLYHLLR